MTPEGSIAPEELRRLESAIRAYERALESACSDARTCSDLNHLAVGGHAKATAVVWAMRRTRVLPR